MDNRGAAPSLVVTMTTALALVPSAAFAVDYLSVEQAARLMFPQADRFDGRTVAFDAEQLRKLQSPAWRRARRAGRCRSR
jgi:hypothetical protein